MGRLRAASKRNHPFVSVRETQTQKSGIHPLDDTFEYSSITVLDESIPSRGPVHDPLEGQVFGESTVASDVLLKHLRKHSHRQAVFFDGILRPGSCDMHGEVRSSRERVRSEAGAAFNRNRALGNAPEIDITMIEAGEPGNVPC